MTMSLLAIQGLESLSRTYVQGPYLAHQLSVFRTSPPTNKFLCAHYGFHAVCSVGIRFILVWAERPYIESLVARATVTLVS
jgi:hypothetical protein